MNALLSGVEDIPIGRLRVRVKQGDITKEKADCIINSTNLQLDINRGMALVIYWYD